MEKVLAWMELHNQKYGHKGYYPFPLLLHKATEDNKKANLPDMKRSPLRKKGKSDTAKCKDRIQKLLTQIVRIVDGGCIFRNFPETGLCSGYTAADHIISRVRSVSYGDLRNVICLCNRHHIYWKPQNPVEYNSIVKNYVGPERWGWIEKVLADKRAYPLGIYEWGKIEMSLNQELQKLQA